MSDVAGQLDPVALRDAYDAQLRAWVPPRLPSGAIIESDGPLVRMTGLDPQGFVTYVSLGGVDGPELDALIARQRDYYAARGLGVEWKLHGHDLPADLPARLMAAGFVPEEQETVVVGLAAPLAAAAPPLPAGVRLREVTARTDLDRIAAMEATVWGEDRSHLASSLERELAADASGTTVVVAEAMPDAARSDAARSDPAVSREAVPGQAVPDADVPAVYRTDVASSTGASGLAPGGRDALGTVVSAGWVRYVPGTAFATLWGGSTLVPWRGRGIYRALVAYRAHLAVARGHTYLQVDASDDSRPILQRCGFVPVTTTTPYLYRPV